MYVSGLYQVYVRPSVRSYVCSMLCSLSGQIVCPHCLGQAPHLNGLGLSALRSQRAFFAAGLQSTAFSPLWPFMAPGCLIFCFFVALTIRRSMTSVILTSIFVSWLLSTLVVLLVSEVGPAEGEGGLPLGRLLVFILSNGCLVNRKPNRTSKVHNDFEISWWDVWRLFKVVLLRVSRMEQPTFATRVSISVGTMGMQSILGSNNACIKQNEWTKALLHIICGIKPTVPTKPTLLVKGQMWGKNEK